MSLANRSNMSRKLLVDSKVNSYEGHYVLSTGNRTIVKPHQLVIINLKTDKVIHRFNLPENVLTPVTVLASLTIDTPKGSCGDAFAYFPGMLVTI